MRNFYGPMQFCPQCGDAYYPDWFRYVNEDTGEWVCSIPCWEVSTGRDLAREHVKRMTGGNDV